ncbi:uncharacterized protein C3orf14 homolog [Protopterus annectens]|uniref:uncharacterized protein C3orf14 homolog n=1 Tax=Protopterus annectens TaxID=7888 RepID=UPI001CFAE8CF|nr:uncharacterized protein C3orf14 homolog [Protopterus annectens]XP_043933451.1 uncharacterized protein C3orf14 homolog [Protopterus annectens]
MTSYLAQEVELSKRHEAILSQRAVLLQQMESHLEVHRTGKEFHAVQAEAARQRNTELKNDLKYAVEQLKTRRRRTMEFVHPDIVNLETHYWGSIEENIPKWEQFLLGKAKSPRGMKTKAQSKKEHHISQILSSPKDRPKSSSGGLPPSGLISKPAVHQHG